MARLSFLDLVLRQQQQHHYRYDNYSCTNTMSNKLHRLVTSVNTSPLPTRAKQAALSLLFNSQVKLAFTCGIQIQELSNTRAQLRLNNSLRVQNHIGGVHACGMALLAESATGIVFGMNVPDTCVPLIKSMSIQYKKRAKGDLQAVASLTPQQVRSFAHFVYACASMRLFACTCLHLLALVCLRSP